MHHKWFKAFYQTFEIYIKLPFNFTGFLESIIYTIFPKPLRPIPTGGKRAEKCKKCDSQWGCVFVRMAAISCDKVQLSYLACQKSLCLFSHLFE